MWARSVVYHAKASRAACQDIAKGVQGPDWPTAAAVVEPAVLRAADYNGVPKDAVPSHPAGCLRKPRAHRCKAGWQQTFLTLVAAQAGLPEPLSQCLEQIFYIIFVKHNLLLSHRSGDYVNKICNYSAKCP